MGSDNTAIIEKFKNIGELEAGYRKALRKALRLVSEEDFRTLFAPLFEKYPEFLAVAWTQYIPSFNDGDPCHFMMTDYCVFKTTTINPNTKKPFTISEIASLNSFYEYAEDFDDVPEFNKDFKKATEIITNDIAEAVFEANTVVVISREGFNNSEYIE